MRYVKPGLLPFLAAAAIALLAIGAVTLWYEFTPERQGGRHSGAQAGATPRTADSHKHRAGRRMAASRVRFWRWPCWLRPPSGSDAAVHSGTALAAPTGDFPPLPEGDPASLTLMDYASRAVFDEGRSIGDRTVRLTGFVIRGSQGRSLCDPHGAELLCVRMPVQSEVGLSGDVPGDLPNDAWVEVIGTYSPHQVVDEINSGIIPFIQASSVIRIAPPTDPYGS